MTAPTLQSTSLAERTDEVWGTLRQEPPQVAVTRLGEAPLWIPLAGLTPFRPKAELIADISALAKAVLISYGQDRGERCQCADPTDLRQGLCFRLLLLRHLPNEFVLSFDLFMTGLPRGPSRF